MDRCPPASIVAVIVAGWLAAAAVAPTAGVVAAEPAPATSSAATSSTAARSAYAAAAALHNREAWDLAAEEWQSFLKSHPRDTLAPKARCYLGICQMNTDRWPLAITTFDAVIRAGVDPEAVALARWELARGTFAAAQASNAADDFRTAAARLGDLLTAAPAHPQAAAALHLLGESLWQSGRPAEALAAWRRFTADHARSPLLPDVLYALGVGEAETGARAEATQTLARFAKEFPTHALAPDVGLWRADVAADAGDLAAAETILTALVSAATPRTAEALDRLGRVRERRDDRAGAIAAYTALARDHAAAPLAGTARVATGRLLLAEGRADSARVPLEEALAGGGAAAVAAAHLLARIAIDGGRFDRALEVVESGRAAATALPDPAVLEADDLPRLELDRADALRRLPARRDESIAACDALAKARPDAPLAATAAALAALTLLDLDRPAAALDRTDALIKRFVDRPDAVDAVRDARLVRAEALVALDRPADAAAALGAFVAELPGDPRAPAAWYRLGEIERDRADQAAARAAFTRCHAAAPQGPRAAAALLAAGWCAAALGQPADAVATWTRVIDTYPGDAAAPAARLARADARRRAGDAAAALADVRTLLTAAQAAAPGVAALEPAARSEARLLEGLCLAAMGNDAAAATALGALVRDEPDAAVADRALHEFALACERQGRSDDAARAYAALVERFPQSPLTASALLASGELRWDAGDHAAAAVFYARALKAAADPAGPLAERALHKLGWSGAVRGDHAAAADAFTRQVAAVPRGPLAADGHAMLGQSLLALDRAADARAALAAALADPAALSSPEMRASTFIRAAEAAAAAEKWQESLDLAQAFLAAEPGSPQAPQARYAAAWALQHLGRLDEAVGRYRAIADGRPTDIAARARLMEGEALFEKGDHRGAIKAFFKVAYGFGGAEAPPAFHPWQAQATFEAARCFEVLAQPRQARDLYAELIERYPDAEQAPAARRRLEALSAAGPGPDGAAAPQTAAARHLVLHPARPTGTDR
jgi:TolA-binding protein